MKVPGFWILSFICLTIFAKSIADEPRVVCYYTNWSIYRPGNAKYSPQNINPYLCTHLIYAFGGFTKDNTLQPFDKYQDIEKGGYAKFTGLKTYNKNLKTLLAIGGWNEASSRFSPLVGDADRRRTFVKNSVKYLRQNHFDGLDLDWEYPTFRDGGKLKDRVNYAQFVQELREEFDRESSKTGRPRLLLTLAIPAGVDKIDQGYDVIKLNQYLDWFNVLTYDYHDSFEPATNHHAPLYSLEEDNEYNYDSELNIDFSVKHLIKSGADRQKLVLGIPTYGRSYTLFNPDATDIGAPTDGPGDPGDATREKGFLAYYEICQHIKNDEDWTVMHPNDNVMGPYLYKDDQWISYDDEKMARKKAQYAAKNGLGGIMFWAIDTDDFRGTCTGKPYPLIEAAKEGLYNTLGVKSPDSKEVVVKTTTHNRNRPTKKPLISNEASTNVKDNFTRRRKPSTTTTKKPTTESSIVYNSRTTTPEPPTTPDPGSDFKCEDEGFFSHPRDCKKYFWCLDSGPSNLGIVAHQFTCPTGLVFNKQADSCDYARNVICSKTKPSTTTTGSPPTTTSKTTTKLSTTQRTTTFRTTTSRPTTTSTTTPAYEYDDEEYDDEIENEEPERDIEDPKVIKELIDLIKKAGGLDKLEKHLKFSEDNLSVFDATKSDKLSTTQATFSKSLYDKVLIRKPGDRFVKTENTNKIKSDRDVISVTPKVNNTRYSSVYRNSRPSPQNAGLEDLTEFDAFLKEKPQYVTIQRHRSTTSASEKSDDGDSQEDSEEYFSADTTTRSIYQATAQPQYVNIQRNRVTTESTDEDESEEIVLNPFSRPIESITQSSQYASINGRRKPDNEDKVQAAILSSSDTESATQYTTINRGRRPGSSDSGDVSITSDFGSGIQYSTINRGRRPDNRDSAETTSSSEVEATTQYSTINRRRRPETSDTTEISSPSDVESTTQYASINRRRKPDNSDTASDTETTTQYTAINRSRRPDNSEKVENLSESDTGAIAQSGAVSGTVNSRTRTRYQSISRGSAATTSSEDAKVAGEKINTQPDSTDKYSDSREGAEVEAPINRVFPALLNSNTKYQTITRNQIKTTILETTLADDLNIPQNNTTDLLADNAIQKETPPPPPPPPATPVFNNNLIGINLNNTNNELTTNHNLTTPTNTINITANQINTDITFTLKPHQPSNETLNDLNDVQAHTVKNVTEFITTKLSSPRPFGFQKPNKTILLNQTRAPKVSQVENLEPNKTISNPIINEQDNLGKKTVSKQEFDIMPLVDRARFSYSSVTSPKSVIELQTVNVSDQEEGKDQSSFSTINNSGVTFEQSTISNQAINFGSNVNNHETKYQASVGRGGFRFSSETNPTANTDFAQTTNSNQNVVNTQHEKFSFDSRGSTISSSSNAQSNADFGSNTNVQESNFQSSFDRRDNRISSSSGSRSNTDSISSTTINFGSNVNAQESKYKSSSDIRGSRITPSASPIASNDVEQTDSQNINTNLGAQEAKSQASFDRRGFRISSSSSPTLNADFEQKTISSQTLLESSNANVGNQDTKFQSSEQTNSGILTTNLGSNFNAHEIKSQSSFDSRGFRISASTSPQPDLEQASIPSPAVLESSNSTRNLELNVGTQEAKVQTSYDRSGSRVTPTTSPTASTDIEQTNSQNLTTNLGSNISPQEVKSQTSFDSRDFRISASTSTQPDLEQSSNKNQTVLGSSHSTTDLELNVGTQETKVESSYDRRGSRITPTTSSTASSDVEQKQTDSRILTTNLGSNFNAHEVKTQSSFDSRGFRITSSTSPQPDLEQTSNSNQTLLESSNSTTDLKLNVGTQEAKVQSYYDSRGFRITPTTSTDVEQTDSRILTTNLGSSFNAHGVKSQTSFGSLGFSFSATTTPNTDFEEITTTSQALLESGITTTDLGLNVGSQEGKFQTSFNSQGFIISSPTSPKLNAEFEQTTTSIQSLLESSTTISDIDSNVGTQEAKVQSSYDRRGYRITPTTGLSASTEIEQTDSRNLTTNLSSNISDQKAKSQTSFDRRGFRISASTSPQLDLEQTTTPKQTLLEASNSTTNLGSNVGTQDAKFQSSFDRRGFRISTNSSQTLLDSSNSTTDLELNGETQGEKSTYGRKGSRITPTTGSTASTDVEKSDSQNLTTNLGSNFSAHEVNSQTSFDRRGFRISSSTTPKSEFEETTTSRQDLLESSVTTTDISSNVGSQEAKVQSSFDRRGFRISASTSPQQDLEQTTTPRQILLESSNFTSNLGSNVGTQDAKFQSSFDRRGFRISTTSSQTLLESSDSTRDLELNGKTQGEKSTYVRKGSRITPTTRSTASTDVEKTGSQNLTTNFSAQEVNSQTSFGRRGFRISSSTTPKSELEETTTSSQALLESSIRTTAIGSNVGSQEPKFQSSYDRTGPRITPTTGSTASTDNEQTDSRNLATNLGSNFNAHEVKSQSSFDRRGFRISASTSPTSNADLDQTTTHSHTLLESSNSKTNSELNGGTQDAKFQYSYDRRGFRITPTTSPTASTDIEQTTIFDSSLSDSQNLVTNLASNNNTQEGQDFEIFSSTSPKSSTDFAQTTLSSQTLTEFENSTTNEANIGQELNSTTTLETSEQAEVSNQEPKNQYSFGSQGFQVSVTSQNSSIESGTSTTNSNINVEQSTISSQTLLESEISTEPKFFQISSSTSPSSSTDVEKPTISSQRSNIPTTEEPKFKPTIRRGFRISASTTPKSTVDVEQSTSTPQLLFESRNSTSLRQNITTQEPKSKPTIDRRRFKVSSAVSNRPAVINTEQTTFASQLVTEPRSTTLRTITRNRGTRRFYSQPTTEAQAYFSDTPAFKNNLTRKYRPVYEETQEPVNYNTLLNRDVRPSNLDDLSTLTAFDFNRQSYNTRTPTIRRRNRPAVVRTTTTETTLAPSPVSTESNISTEGSTRPSTEAQVSFTEKPTRKTVIRKLRPVAPEIQEAVDYNSLLNRNVRPVNLDELSSLTSIDFNRKNYDTGNTVVRRRPRPPVVTSTTPQEISSEPTESNIGTDNTRIYKRPLSRNQYSRPTTAPSTTTTRTPVILPKPVSHNISVQIDPPYESPEPSTFPPITLSLSKSFDFGFASRKPNSTDRNVFENDSRSNTTINVTTTAPSIDITSATTEQILPNDTTTAQIILAEQNSLNVTTENNQSTNNVTNTIQNVPLSETKTRSRVRTVKRLRDPIKQNAIIENTIEIIGSTETPKAINFSLSNPTIETIVNEGFNFQPTDTSESDTIPLRGRLSTTTNTVESETQTDSTIQRRRQFQSRVSTTPTTTLITESNSEADSQVSGNSSTTNGSRVKVVNRTFRRRPGTKLEINVNSTLDDENVEPNTQIDSTTETRRKFGVSKNTNSQSVSRFNARTQRPLKKLDVNQEELESDDSAEETSPLVDKELDSSTQKSSFIPPRRAFAPRTFTTAATTVNIESSAEASENITSTSGPKSTSRPRFKVNRTFTRRPFTQIEVTSNEPVDEDEANDKEIESNSQIETSTQARKKYASRFSATQSNTETDSRVSGNVSRFKVRTFTRKPVTSVPNNEDENSEETVPLSEEELDSGIIVESTTARRKFISGPFASSSGIKAQAENETENTGSDTAQPKPSLPARKKFISRVSTTPASLNTQSVTENKNSINASKYNSFNRPRGPFTKPEIKSTSTTEVDSSEENFTSGEVEVDSVTLETVTDNQVSENEDSLFVTSTLITTLEDENSEENISSSTEELKPSTTRDPSIKPRRKIKIIKGTTTKRPEQALNSTEELDLANSEEIVVSNKEELENNTFTTISTLVETTTAFPSLEIDPQDEENLPLDDTELDFNALKTTSTPTTLANEVTESRASENITPTSASRFKVRTFTRRPATQVEISSKDSVDDDNLDDEEIESNGQKNTSTQSQRKYVSRIATSQTNTETEGRVNGNLNKSNVPRYKIRAFTRKPSTTTSNASDDDDVSSDENLLIDNEEVESSSPRDASVPTRRSFRKRISSTTPIANTRLNGEVEINASRFKAFNRNFTRKPTTQVEISSNASNDGDQSAENSAEDDDEIESNTQPDVSLPTRRTLRPRISTTSRTKVDVDGLVKVNSTGASRFKVFNRTFTRKPATQVEVNSNSSIDDGDSEENFNDEEIESNTHPDPELTNRTAHSQINEETGISTSENINSSGPSRFNLFNRNFTLKSSTGVGINSNAPVDVNNSEENSAIDDDEIESNTQPDFAAPTRKTFRPILPTAPSSEETEIRISENTNATNASRFKVFNRNFTRNPITQVEINNNSSLGDDNSEENSEEIESNTQPDHSAPTRSTFRPRISTSSPTVNKEINETVIGGSENINSTSSGSRFKVFNRTFALKPATLEINSNLSIDDDNSDENSTIIDSYNRTSITNGTDSEDNVNSEENILSGNEEIESNTQLDSSTPTKRTFIPRVSTTPSTLASQADSDIRVSETGSALKFSLGNRTRKPFGQHEINKTDDGDSSDENTAEEEIEPNPQIDVTKERRKYVSRITTTPEPPPLRFKVFNRSGTRKPSTTLEPIPNESEDDGNSEEVEVNTQIGSGDLNSPTPRYKTFTRKPFTRLQINANEPGDTENTEDSQELESNSQIDSNSQTGRKYVSRISATQTNSETETRVFGSSNSFNGPRYGVINRTRKPFTRPDTNDGGADEDDNLDENDEEDETNSGFSNAQSNSGNINLPITRYSTIDRTVTRKPFTRLETNADEEDETENSDDSGEFESNSQSERKYVSRISQSNSETETRISGGTNAFNGPRYGVVNRTRKPFTRPEINSNGDDNIEENSYSDNGELKSNSPNDLSIQARKKFVPRISNNPTNFNGQQSNSESGSRVSGNVPRYRPTPTRPSQNVRINSNDDLDEDYDEDDDRFEENLTGNDESVSSFSRFDTSTQSIRKFKPRISANSIKLNTQSSSESSLPSGYRNKAIFQRKPFTRPANTNEATDSDDSEESVTIKTDDDESNTEHVINNDDDEIGATTIATGEFISESETPSTLSNNFTQTIHNLNETHSQSSAEHTNSSVIETLRSNIVDNENETESEFELNRNDLDAGLVISNENISFNTTAPPSAPASQKVINKPFSGTLNNFSKSQGTQVTGSQNSPVQSTKIDSNKFIPFHLRQQNTFNKIGVLTTTPPSLAPLPKFSHEEIETTTGSISYTDYSNIPHSTTLDTSTPIISTIADINLYSTLISQESTTTIAGDEVDKVTEITIVPLKKLKSTTTSKPTTLHHIFAVDYDSAEEDRNNGTNLGNSTELNDDDEEGGNQDVSAEEISQRLEKLVEINRIVEIYSKQRSNNGHNDLSNSNELILEKIPTIDKIGEISRWISVKLQNHNSSGSNHIQEILRNITQLEQTLNSTAANTTFDSKMIFDVETSTIPLEGLFDKNKKTLNDNEVIDYQTTNPSQPPPPPPLSALPPHDNNPINVDSFTGSTNFGIAAATIPNHNYVQQLRPESHEANPLVISIANLDQVVLSKSDKIDKKISYPSSAIGTTESSNQLTFSSNSDLTN